MRALNTPFVYIYVGHVDYCPNFFYCHGAEERERHFSMVSMVDVDSANNLIQKNFHT